ncbi:MAG: inositol monophosphatase, partial [Candidatus Omnitrophota bacterium]
RHKQYREIVTNCDIASETAITGYLLKHYPGAKVFSEEVGEITGSDETVFIVDPIDGTHNFIHNIPFYAISIGMYTGDRPYAGIIYLPEFDEYFYAVQGGGAYCNGTKITCSKTEKLKDAVIVYDNQFHLNQDMARHLMPIVEHCFTLRIFGSACVDLCNVARGTVEARIFHRVKSVDFAAGYVIIKEAGGSVVNFQGRPASLTDRTVIASNGKIENEIITLFNSVDKGNVLPELES